MEAGRGAGAGHDDRSGALWWLTTRWLRRHWLSAVPVALIVCAGTAGAVTAIGTATRTSSAFGDHVRRADVGDVVVNPSVSTREVDAVIRSLPGVERATSHAMLLVTTDGGAPRTRREVVEGDDGPVLLVVGSSDGRYVDMDRPVVHDGRLPSGEREAVLSLDAARQLELDIGDVATVSFWASQPTESLEPAVVESFLEEVIEPVGVEEVTIVGTVAVHDEVLPDELYPRGRVILSPDLAGRYDCLPTTPAADATPAEVVAALFAADCSTLYRYYSLALADGADGVEAALDGFLRATSSMRPAGGSAVNDAGEEEPGYFLIPTATAADQRRVDRAVQPTVAALVVLGLSVAVLTIALTMLAVARTARAGRDEHRQWRQLGMSRSGSVIAMATPPLLAVLVAAVIGTGVAASLAIGPIGPVAVLEPHPGRRLGEASWLTGALIGVVAAALTVAVVRHSTRASAVGRTSHRVRAIGAPSGRPVLDDGLRAAFGSRTSLPVVAGAVLVSGALVAAAVFATSLAALVSTPRAYGWTWDVAAMSGFGYGGLDFDAAAALVADDDVRARTVLGFVSEVTLEGEPTMTVIGFDRTTDVDLELLRGDLPSVYGEVAVGADTAERHGVDVGDTVIVGGAVAATESTVTGIVVFPSLGPYLSDRVGAGTGLLLPEEAIAMAALQYDESSLRDMATFVGVEVSEEDAESAVERVVADELAPLDLSGAQFVYEEPVRPPEIVGAQSARVIPLAVGLGLGAVAAAGLAFASWGSMRARRKDLAVLRALGFDNRQVRRSVHVQSVATVLGAMVVGVPLGVVTGRVLWRAFANQLGVVPDPAGVWLVVGVAVAAGVVVALAVSVVPARIAARASPAAGLRAE